MSTDVNIPATHAKRLRGCIQPEGLLHGSPTIYRRVDPACHLYENALALLESLVLYSQLPYPHPARWVNNKDGRRPLAVLRHKLVLVISG